MKITHNIRTSLKINDFTTNLDNEINCFISRRIFDYIYFKLSKKIIEKTSIDELINNEDLIIMVEN